MSNTDVDDFIIRTEDLRPEQTLSLFVSTERDDQLIALLRSGTPLVLEGSRGTGKSFLLRVCEQKQLQDFKQDRILPVYVSFNKSSLLNAPSQSQFLHWMLSRLCSQVLRTLQKRGLSIKPPAARVLSGDSSLGEQTKLERISEAFENSYRTPEAQVDVSDVPSIERFRDAIEDVCSDLDIRRINVLFDEAAHIFRPEQQRQFFTLFRDLRSPYMTCNAAVYPGVTAYGGVFETAHDARVEPLNRDITNPSYLNQMRNIVLVQATSSQQADIERNGENFDALAYAVTGNPRILLKTVSLAKKLRTSDVQATLKEFFRSSIWSEHSSLSERYPGHRGLIDWGRSFVEDTVIVELTHRNNTWREEKKGERSNTIWIHRDAPEVAKEAMRLLTYTGILTKYDDGAISTRSQIGSRYFVNIGCLTASSPNPITTISDLRRGNTIKRFTEFGANHAVFVDLASKIGAFVEADVSSNLPKLLASSTTVLDISEHQKSALASIGIDTIGKALSASEEAFQQAHYIGPKRSRRIMNVVTGAALEYLSG
jgi:hypothetical protein